MDAFKNFAKATVSTGYDAAATTVVLTGGHGALLPVAPFNVVWWNSTDFPDPTDDPNVELVRVTGISTDTLTVVRAQEGMSASTKNTGGKTYKMAAALTALTINALGKIPFVTVEKDLGSLPVDSGFFDITGLSGLTPGAPVLIAQANGPYTGKGTQDDDSEFDALLVTAYAYSSSVIRAHWASATGQVSGNFKFNYAT